MRYKNTNPSTHLIISVTYALCIIGVVLTITGCAQTPKPMGKPLADMTFAHMQPIPIDARRIDTNIGYNITSPAASYFRTSPSILFRRYMNQRLAASGDDQSGILDISIPEISLHEKRIKKGSAYTPWAPQESYLYMLVKIEMSYRHDVYGVKETSLQARRVTKLHENMSITQREMAAQALIEGLINDLDEKLIERARIISSYMPQ